MIGRGIPSIQSNMPRPIGKSPHKIFSCRDCLTVCACISSFCKAEEYADWVSEADRPRCQSNLSAVVRDWLAKAPTTV